LPLRSCNLQSGTVRICGHDLRQVSIDELRGRIVPVNRNA